MHSRIPLTALAIALCIALYMAPRLQGAQEQPPHLLDRVVVMGASVSAGFGLSKELEVATSLSVLIDAAIKPPSPPAIDLSDNLFFLGPKHTGKFLTEQALRANPTLLIAVDYLFWYGMFWQWENEADRLLGLELGLMQLERFDCPIVIGDFPDIRQALQGKHEVTGRPVVFPSMIPEEATRLQMNQVVEDWANQHDHVTLVPLSSFLAGLASGQALLLPDKQTLSGSMAEILQVDLLHPRLAGCEALVLIVLDKIRSADWGLLDTDIHWNRAALHGEVLKQTESKREQARRSQKRRERIVGRR